MFRPAKPETLMRRAHQRSLDRIAALPEMIRRREAMAAKSTHPDDVTHWEASAEALRQELIRYVRTAPNFPATQEER